MLSHQHHHQQYLINLDNVNPNLRNLSFSIKGPVVTRAHQIQNELIQGIKKPFTEIIKTNAGDPQAMGQKPITFIRQILAVISYPKLFEDPNFPDDVKQRAKCILDDFQGTIGSYGASQGMHILRKQAVKYIEERDGIPTDYQNIQCSNGASGAIQLTMNFLNCDINGKRPGILMPCPQYPLYDVFAKQIGMYGVLYHLDEDNNWGLDIAQLQRTVDEARESCHPRILVIINPGNPTGQILTRKNIEDIIKFAYKEKLLIFADEVYQQNIYDDNCKFYSFKKVAWDLGAPYNRMEIASFFSVSKGFMGECGIRGGYVELLNVQPEVRKLFMHISDCSLCPNNYGQAALYAALDPPRPGEPSYELFIKEKTQILSNLKTKARMIEEMFNSLDGFQCNKVQAAFYAFPRITLPDEVIEEANKKGMSPDTLYCFELLEKTGICVIPGSGFGQKDGTYHFRTTIMPPIEKLLIMVEKFKQFHNEFVKRYT